MKLERKSIRIPQRKNMPLHLKQQQDRWYSLIRFATLSSGLYGVPIYLVGSALQDDNPEPRDWDLRCCFTHKMFEIKFGSVKDYIIESGTGIWTIVSHRWANECVKRTKKAWTETNLNIDFQIQPTYIWKRFKHLPRLRLDMRDLIKR